MTKRLLFPIVALALAACLGSDFADSLKGSWVLQSGSIAGEPLPILNDHPITMNLDGRRITGVAACNTYSGEYELSGIGGFRIRDGLAVTEMACVPSDAMESEQRFLEALTQVDRIELGNARLTMSGGESRLEFVLAET